MRVVPAPILGKPIGQINSVWAVVGAWPGFTATPGFCDHTLLEPLSWEVGEYQVFGCI